MLVVKYYEVQGEQAEEVARLLQLLRGSEQSRSDLPASESGSISASNANSPDGTSITADLVLRVLARRPLEANAKKVLKTLQRSGQNGMTTEELAKAVGIDRGQLAGVCGAFGRRVANTKGWPSKAEFIAHRRDDKGRRRSYLPSVVHQALDKTPLS